MAMTGFEQMMAGLSSLSTGMKNLATTRATSQAQDEVNALNSTEMDEMDKRNKLSAVAQNLTLRLSGIGADPTQIAQVTGAIKPANFADAQDMYIQSQLNGSKKLDTAAKNVQKFEEDPKLAQIRLQGDYSLRAAQAKAKEMDDKSYGKEFSKLVDDINPNRARSGELGKLQSRINAAGRVDALYAASQGNPNPVQMRELGTTVANMLTMGSQTAVAQIDELVPDTMKGDSNKIKQWLSNNPTGLEQQQFAKQYFELAGRERKQSAHQLKLAQYDAIAKKAHLEGQNPSMFKQLFRGDLKQDEYQKFIVNGGTLPDETDAAAKATAWVNDPANANDPRLQAVKNSLGIK